jgi:hypothetical protein
MQGIKGQGCKFDPGAGQFSVVSNLKVSLQEYKVQTWAFVPGLKHLTARPFGLFFLLCTS